MKKVAPIVRSLIDDNISDQESLRKGVINYTNYAEYLKKDVEKAVGHSVNTSTIRAAVVNYAYKLTENDFIFDSNIKCISTKSDICYLRLEESIAIAEKLHKINMEINNQKGGVINILHGSYETGIITNQHNKEKIKNELYDEKLIKEEDKVALISIEYSQKTDLSGILCNVARYLLFEKIPILATLNTHSEILLVIPNDDLPKCHMTLSRMKSDNENEKERLNKSVTKMKNINRKISTNSKKNKKK